MGNIILNGRKSVAVVWDFFSMRNIQTKEEKMQKKKPEQRRQNDSQQMGANICEIIADNTTCSTSFYFCISVCGYDCDNYVYADRE